MLAFYQLQIEIIINPQLIIHNNVTCKLKNDANIHYNWNCDFRFDFYNKI